ncbi:Uncharacterised protein [Vibrio cholerae]|nr:Uncharacterised protein [Vibrio cholerae]
MFLLVVAADLLLFLDQVGLKQLRFFQRLFLFFC